MRFHRVLVAGSLWASFLITHVASGQEAVDLIRNAKAATALVVLPGGKGYASAFCIDPAGFFVTNVHVVHDLTPGQRVSLVLHSGEDAETVISAEPIRQDPVSDLALLKADGFKQLTPLAIGSAATLTETQQVTAFGYPFGKMLSMDKKSYPSISVNVARVSSLRRQKGALELVQLDSQLNPGNSGGPVIDAKGKVIGVISSGVLASGINFAVPAEKLLALVEKPELVFTPPQIADAKRSDPVTLTIQTVCIGRPSPDMTVDVTLTTPDGATRIFPARASGRDAWTVSVVPVPPKPAATRFPAVVTFPDSTLHCSVDDVIVRLDSKPFRLSQISRIDTHDGIATFTLVDHTTVSGAAQSVPMFKASVGGTTMPIDVARVLNVVFEQPSSATSVTYRITAKSKGAMVSEATGVLFGDAPAASTAAASSASPAAQTAVAGSKSKPADGGPIASADYCTLLYVPKLQEILGLDPSQRTKCEEMSRKMDQMLERSVNDPNVPAIAMTANTMVRRAKGVLDREGQSVHDLLTPQQDQQLADYFATGRLKPIEVRPLSSSNTKSHLPPHPTGIHSAAGVLIVYSQFNEKMPGPIAAAGPELPAAPPGAAAGTPKDRSASKGPSAAKAPAPVSSGAPPIVSGGTATTPAPGIRVESRLSREERETLKDVNSATDAVRLLSSGAQERRVAAYWLATSRIDLVQRAAVLTALKPLLNEPDGKKRLPIVQAFEHWADAAHAADLAGVIAFPAQVQGISHQETCWAVALAGLVRVAPAQAERAMNSRIDSLFFRSDATKALQPIADADCPQKELAKVLIEQLHNHH